MSREGRLFSFFRFVLFWSNANLYTGNFHCNRSEIHCTADIHKYHSNVVQLWLFPKKCCKVQACFRYLLDKNSTMYFFRFLHQQKGFEKYGKKIRARREGGLVWDRVLISRNNCFESECMGSSISLKINRLMFKNIITHKKISCLGIKQ